MSRENLLNSFSETSKNFFNEFIKDFKPDISSEEFNKFKFQFINMLIEVKLSQYKDGFETEIECFKLQKTKTKKEG